MAERTEAPDVPVYNAERAEATRNRIFFYDIFMFLVLVVLAWAYFAPGIELKKYVPVELQGIPIYAFWLGALGGIVISLKGVYDHSPRDWQVTYNLWHYGRPFSGGIAGAVMYLLLLAVSGSAPSAPITLAAAFIIGTQERRFFNFLSEVARLIVQVPGDPQDDNIEVREVHPIRGVAGTRITILGAGFQPGATAWIGASKLDDVVVSRDGATITGLAPAGSGQSRIMIENPDGTARIVTTTFTYDTPVDPTDLAFASQDVGTTSPSRQVARHNTGAADVTNITAALSGPNAADYQIVGNTCTGATLKPGETCTIDLQFQPTSAGPSSAVLTVADSSGNYPVTLAGTGVRTAQQPTTRPPSPLPPASPPTPSAPPSSPQAPSPRPTGQSPTSPLTPSPSAPAPTTTPRAPSPSPSTPPSSPSPTSPTASPSSSTAPAPARPSSPISPAPSESTPTGASSPPTAPGPSSPAPSASPTMASPSSSLAPELPSSTTPPPSPTSTIPPTASTPPDPPSTTS